jgi:hypothetical protein
MRSPSTKQLSEDRMVDQESHEYVKHGRKTPLTLGEIVTLWACIMPMRVAAGNGVHYVSDGSWEVTRP